MELCKLLLRPDFISSASLYLMLKQANFFGAKQVYVISPADLDFIQVDTSIKKFAINSTSSDLVSKVSKIPMNAFVLIDGVMLHSKLKLLHRTDVLFIDALGLPTSYRNLFASNNIRALKIKTPELLYCIIQTDDTNQSLDQYLDLLPEYRHIIFGSSGDKKSITEFKESITKFNDEGNGFFYINAVPPRNINNCDYLHMTTTLYPWEFEYLTAMLFRSNYTTKDLKVVFYITPSHIEQYNTLAAHLLEHLQYEDDLVEIVQYIHLQDGFIVW